MSAFAAAPEAPEDDEDDERNEDIFQLRRAIMNEKGAPEILEYQHDLVDDLKELVENQQEEVDRNRQTGPTEFFNASLYQMEIERVNWMLRCYNGVRLRKIEQHPLYITSRAEFTDRLSEAEYGYAKSLIDAQSKYFGQVLNLLPTDQLRSLTRTETDDDMVTAPAMDSYVFCKVNEDLGPVEVNADGAADVDEQVIELNKDDIYCLQYQVVEKFVARGEADLI